MSIDLERTSVKRELGMHPLKTSYVWIVVRTTPRKHPVRRQTLRPGRHLCPVTQAPRQRTRILRYPNSKPDTTLRLRGAGRKQAYPAIQENCVRHRNSRNALSRQ